MNTKFLILAALCSSQNTHAIIEGCHDRITTYTVLALITGDNSQKDMVLDFDCHDHQDDDQHALTQECAKQGYELREVKHIKITQRPILVTREHFSYELSIKHYRALVSVKRPDLARPIVLRFERRLELIQKETADDIKRWCQEECTPQDYHVLELQKIKSHSCHWKAHQNSYVPFGSYEVSHDYR